MNGEALPLPASAVALLAALGVGLVIGLERGWRDRDVADGGRVAGLRTFALTGLLGGVCALAGPWLLGAGGLGLALLCAVSYREGVRATGNLSATSAVAQLLAFGLGAFAAGGAPVLAMSAAVIVAVLLDLRSTLHRWLQLIEHRELNAALQMLVLSAVVLPALPDAGYGPYGALNPYRLWWAVVLIAGLSLSGHIAIRMSGVQRGVFWTGLLGGLASSTAATLALARRLREQPHLLDPTIAGVLAACATMFLRISVVVLLLAPSLAMSLLPATLTSAAVLFALALGHWQGSPHAPEPADTSALRPFDLGTALAFGAFIGVVSVVAAALREWIGSDALYGLGLLSGLLDVDAITVSMARLVHVGSVEGRAGALVIGLAVLSNTSAKVVLAWTAGGPALGRRIGLCSLAAVTAGAVVLAAVSVLR
jgi:uncharacterized membrane protein (DUF4010 family)